tara:strand:- start:1284 stop:1529 length:246 start_codon:yes stop_codon:yes gene_type:complete
MKWFILIVMMAGPGEFIEHHVFESMPFNNVEECTHFSETYWQNLTRLAELTHQKEWGNMFCIPEESLDNELIRTVLNEKGI